MNQKAVHLEPNVYQYLLNINPVSNAHLDELLAETKKLDNAVMMSPPEQISFIMFLLNVIKAKKILEIGTFTGYCTLAMALAIPVDGKVITCDLDKSWSAIGASFWEKANVTTKIDLKLMMAQQLLDDLISQHEQFDFIFIDADKVNNWNYFEKSLQLVSTDGIIAVDNVLWGGKPADYQHQDFQTSSIRDFNDKIKSYPGIKYCTLPIGDGLTLVQKNR